MVADTNNNAAAAHMPPLQNADGVARVGAGLPVLDTGMDCFWRIRDANAPIVGRWIKNRGSIAFLIFALLYALAFSIAEPLFPQLYQAWLDLCMPMVEYVGGLSPRAERIAGNLIAGGYPERVDDAMHAIAMTRILLMPAVVCWLAMIFFAVAMSAKTPIVVSCTRRAHINTWFIILILVALSIAMGIYTVNDWEFHTGENFAPIKPLQEFSGYRGNFAIFGDILQGVLSSVFFAGGISLFLMVKFTVRFNIVTQQSEGK